MVDSFSYVLAELDEWQHDEERSQEAFRAPIVRDLPAPQLSMGRIPG
jgi:hypothetical protein